MQRVRRHWVFVLAISAVCCLPCLEANAQELVVDGFTQTFDDNAYHVFSSVKVGVSLPGSQLRVLSDTVLQNYGTTRVGIESTAIGRISISGNNASYQNFGLILVGLSSSAQGFIEVESGGYLGSEGLSLGNEVLSFGSLSVTGSGSVFRDSEYLNIGERGSAVVVLSGGGSIITDGNALLGMETGSSGKVFVRDTGSRFAASSGFVVVGSRGAGELDIQNGGRVESKFGSVAAISGSTGTVRVDGAGSKWVMESHLWVGNEGTGSLSITNGAEVKGVNGSVGSNSGSNGSVEVRGTDSKWTNSGWVDIGTTGTGSLKIYDGGFVSSLGATIAYGATSSGSVDMQGNSRWEIQNSLDVGNLGNGTLQIGTASEVTNLGTTYVGRSVNGIGELTVEGAGSKLTNNANLRVGYSGNGVMNIRSGGTVSNIFGNIAFFDKSRGEVKVDGVGSTWLNSSNLQVGYGGTGKLTISNGGQVSNQFANIGYFATGVGQAKVFGSSSTWNSNRELSVGFEGNGTLEIDNSGTVNSQIGSIGSRVTGTGRVDIKNGGAWSTSLLQVGREGKGQLNLSDEGKVFLSALEVGSLVGSQGSVVVNGNSPLNQLLNVAGTISVGKYGQGSLNLSATKLSNSNVIIGEFAGGNGSMEVNGSRLESSTPLMVGGAGTGSVQIINGSSVYIHSAFIGSEVSSAKGHLTVDNGSSGPHIQVQDQIKIGNSSNESGIVSISSGAVVSPRIEIADGGRLELSGSQSSAEVNDSLTSRGFVLLENNAELKTRNVTFSGGGSAQVTNSTWGGVGGDIELFQVIPEAGLSSTIQIVDSRLKTSQAVIGGAAGSSVSVSVSGENGLWRNSGTISVGDRAQISLSGNGRLVTESLAVLNGSVLSSAGRLYSDGGEITVTNSAIVEGEMTLFASTFSASVLELSKSQSFSMTSISRGSNVTVSDAFVLGGLGQAQVHVLNNSQLISRGSTWVGALRSTSEPPLLGMGYLTIANATANLNSVRVGSFDVVNPDGSTSTVGGSGDISVRDGGTLIVNSMLIGRHGGVFGAGGVLINNGTIEVLHDGIFDFRSSAIKGNGRFLDQFVLDEESTLSPGNSTGTLTFSELTLLGGAEYEWEIAGIHDFDRTLVENQLFFDGSNSLPFSLRIMGMGPIENWDPTNDYEWTIFEAGSLVGFDPANWSIDSTDFEINNDIGSGSFALTHDSTSLRLQFRAVPEPSVACLTGMLAVLLGCGCYRRRRLYPSQPVGSANF